MTSLCPHPKSPRAKRCRPCNVAAMWADPGFRARKAQQSGAILLRLKQDPEFRAKEDAARRRNCAIMNAKRRPLTPEQRELAAKRQSARKLSWCPPHLRDEYRRLVRSKKLTAAQALAVIMAEWDVTLARRTAA